MYYARVGEIAMNPGIEPGSPALQTDALPSEPPGKTGIIYQNSRNAHGKGTYYL